MKVIYEIGDKVKVTNMERGGLCTHGETGGTEFLPKGASVNVIIVNAWEDNEIGQRYVGVNVLCQKFFFGKYDVNIEKIA